MIVSTPQSCCRFGIAIGDITPPIGMYHRMWGAAEQDVSSGVHRPLRATVMYFGKPGAASDGASAQLLIALDHCLLGVDEVEAIRKRAAERLELPIDAVAVTFSHTHAAGLLNRDRESLPGGEFLASYFLRLHGQIGHLALQAAATATEAAILYGFGHCSLAGHRDLFDPERNEWVCGFHPDGEADDTVLVARITDSNARTMATMVNYACHPTTLAWDNTLISPDYPGATRELIENETGAPCVFLQGASGDLGPVEGYVGDVRVAERNGRQLGFAALSVLEALPAPDTSYAYDGAVVSGALIGVWKHRPASEQRRAATRVWNLDRDVISLPYRDDLPQLSEVQIERQQLLEQEASLRQDGKDEEAANIRALVERQTRMIGRLQGMPQGDAYPYEASVWRMGDAIWLTIQGEPYQMLQQHLRARFPDTPIVIATIGNGWGPSYLPPREIYGKGIYQESIAALAPGSLESLIDALGNRIERLLNSSSA